LRARIKKAREWVFAQPLQDVPTMVELMSAINEEQNMKSQWKRIANLQRAAKVLIFLQVNHMLGGMEQLADKITEISQRQYDLANSVKEKEHRITKLNEHLANLEIYNQHKAVYRKYKELDPKKRGAYKEKHAEEISKYESASAYLKNHLNGHGKIPEKDWRAEREKLLAERYAQVDKYYKLKDDVLNVETLRRGAMNLMCETPQREEPKRTQGVAL
jgi:hypothetical protein